MMDRKEVWDIAEGLAHNIESEELVTYFLRCDVDGCDEELSMVEDDCDGELGFAVAAAEAGWDSASWFVKCPKHNPKNKKKGKKR